jgi:hypothetical protein
MSYLDNILTEKKNKTIETISKTLKSYKDTAVSEFKETRLLVRIIIGAAKEYIRKKDFDLSDEDKKFIKDQSSDILKLIPLIVLQVVPGSSIATPFIVKLSQKLGIKLNSKVPEKYKEDKEVKTDGEIDELVGADGSPLGSNIPLLKLDLHPRKTMDQTARSSRVSQFPFIRVYYGESEEKDGKILDEVDYSEAFGYEETRNAKTFKQCLSIFKELGIDDIDDRKSRCKDFGFDPKLKTKVRGAFTKRRLSELEKEKVESILDEIILSKRGKNTDLIKKPETEENETIFKILKRNLESIKNIADKENIDVNKLVRILKKGE